MKTTFKTIIIALLRFRLTRVLKGKNEVIAITGSMGKTTTKTILKQLLSTTYPILATKGGFNTPIGVLLSLLGEKKSGFTSPFIWLGIIWRAYTSMLPSPQKIIVEYGVDRPGDMDELIDILQPQTSIITNIAPVHIGEGLFDNIDAIADEKGKLFTNLPARGMGILNIDNEYLEKISHQETNAEVVTLSQKSPADIMVLDVRTEPNGTSFVYKTAAESIEVFIPVFGEYIAMLAAPAIYIARKNGISFEKILPILQNFHPPSGRGRIFSGKNDSVVWDSSYNSNPKAVEALLQTLPKIPGQRKIILLGDMNELGEESGMFHEQAGKQAAIAADNIFYVGKNFPDFQRGVQSAQGKCQYFKNAIEAGKFLNNFLEPNDILLVKGSQGGIFLEGSVEKLLEHPEDEKFLCRRGNQWEDKRIAAYK